MNAMKQRLQKMQQTNKNDNKLNLRAKLKAIAGEESWCVLVHKIYGE